MIRGYAVKKNMCNALYVLSFGFFALLNGALSFGMSQTFETNISDWGAHNFNSGMGLYSAPTPDNQIEAPDMQDYLSPIDFSIGDVEDLVVPGFEFHSEFYLPENVADNDRAIDNREEPFNLDMIQEACRHIQEQIALPCYVPEWQRQNTSPIPLDAQQENDQFMCTCGKKYGSKKSLRNHIYIKNKQIRIKNDYY